MGNNYSVTMPAPDMASTTKPLTYQALQHIQLGSAVPLMLELEDGSQVHLNQLLRLLPKKRLVAFGMWQQKPVAVKLFFHKRDALRHFRQEIAGHQKLATINLPTPALYHQGKTADRKVYVVIYERLIQAVNFSEALAQRRSFIAAMPLLKKMMFELATQHVLGAKQLDLHFGNFLISSDKIYSLDGAQFVLKPKMLSHKESLLHLALFLSQLGAGVESLQIKLFETYAQARGWIIKPQDYYQLLAAIKASYAKRWQQYRRKIYRNSTQFVAERHFTTQWVCARSDYSEEMHRFLQRPEGIFQHPSCRILKAGRSATVAEVVLSGKKLIVKRYNMKSFSHRLSRAFRPSRAANCWETAHKMLLFNLSTAKPVAFIENRCLGLRGKAYLITEAVAGCDILQALQQKTHAASIIKATLRLLLALRDINLTHGDLKATNILIDAHHKPFLIDLDGAQEHVSMSSLDKTWHKEMQRFLKNFNDTPELQHAFKQQLQKRGF